jgi:bifunctional N-acetylglucosamine-1-phosphate-uridyltransferase/glucosamine-1-phosphate-acetyltransferase GlmU-like protein
MIDRLLDLYAPYVSHAVIVVQPMWDDEARRRAAAHRVPTTVVVQREPTGMLDAVMLARDAVRSTHAGRVWVTWCDQVAMHRDTVARLAAVSDAHGAAPLVMPVAFRPQPYIHLQRDGEGTIVRVLQRREGDQMPSVGESDAGLFSFSRVAFLDELPEYAATVEFGTATGERNLLPFIAWLSSRGEVVTFPCREDIEAVGINTPDELKQIEASLSARESGLP